mgnify:CR=1 FL=1
MLAVMPQFIDPHAPQLPQYLICAATLFFTDLVVMSGYTGLAAKVLTLLREPHHVRWVNRTFGGLFVAAGAVLATFRRAERRRAEARPTGISARVGRPSGRRVSDARDVGLKPDPQESRRAWVGLQADGFRMRGMSG